MSWARAAVSAMSGWPPRARDRSRATWATSRLWVSRLRMKSSVCGPTTWVFAASRRDARRVHHPRPVALERGAHGGVDPLGRLVDDALAGALVVQVQRSPSEVTLLPATDAGAAPTAAATQYVVTWTWS